MAELHVLLQTDIVDSTRVAEQLGDEAWAALSEAHDIAARDLLPKWRGREIDKSDGFLLLFTNVADAVGYALDYHRSATALAIPLAARAGIHVGPLIVRENFAAHVARGAKVLEVDGVAKPLTARVMAIAGGRQTLLTAAARHALGPTDWRVQSHGHWRMKGLAEPLELFEVGGLHAPFVPPADSIKGYRVVQRGEVWVPKHNVAHTLPAERDSFVGRHDALLEIASRFEAGARLVSVLGPGGAGKTRLVKRFGWSWLGDFSGGVWFCDLAPATTVDGIAHGVAQGLNTQLAAADPLGQLADAIAGRGACLVILDNFEQVVRLAEPTLGRWLDRTNQARFIVTSREALGIPGEAVMTLDSLPRDDGVSLLVQRASAAKAGFELSATDAGVVGPLVNLLDGLPLAIELAAARVRVMSVGTLHDRMSERFKLLTSTGGRPDRQVTLRATLDWSWDLLSVEEQAGLAQISAFEGGFTLEAAEAVIDLSALNCPFVWTGDIVQSLVQKSLVRMLENQRFELLVSIQAYATERLREMEHDLDQRSAEELKTASARHWTWYAALHPTLAIRNRCVELDNLVAACRRAAAAGAVDPAVATLRTAWTALKLHGLFRVGVDLANLVLKLSGPSEAQRATVLTIAGMASHSLGLANDARGYFDAALKLMEAYVDSPEVAQLLGASGKLDLSLGNVEAAASQLTDACDISRRFNEAELQCDALNALGTLASYSSRADEAQTHFEEALRIARRVGNARWEGAVLGNLGNLHFERGRIRAAREHHARALELAMLSDDRQWEGNSRCNLGLAEHELGNGDQAMYQYKLARIIAKQMGDIRLQATLACNIGIAFEADNKFDDAKKEYEIALRSAESLGDRRSAKQFRVYLEQLLSRMN